MINTVTSPKVSVIVPVYKAEKYLHRCVDSLLAQTFTDFEVILVDDGSPDRSGELCDEYAKQDTRVRVFHKENGGVSSARNIGLENVRGEWVAFVDSDDWVDVDYLDVFIALPPDIDMIHGGLQQEVTPAKFVRYLVFEQRLLHPIEILTPAYFSSCSVSYFYKRSIIQRGDLKFCTDIKYSEDRQFIIRYLSCCRNDVLLINNQGYRYCLNSGSAVHSKRSYERCLDDLLVLQSLKDYPLAVTNQFVFKLFVKSFILSYCVHCDSDRPDFGTAVNDLRKFTETYSKNYCLFKFFVNYPALTNTAFKLYWKIRTFYYQIKH